jgi:NAD(P)H-dependent flavin oxidoreductase YrpB (nitropropane dioxygenase family)
MGSTLSPGQEEEAVLSTAVTELGGCQVPIQPAAMGSVGALKLSAAIADLGGLGMVSMAMATVDRMAAELERLSVETSGVVGINSGLVALSRVMTLPTWL